MSLIFTEVSCCIHFFILVIIIDVVKHNFEPNRGTHFKRMITTTIDSMLP